VRPRRGGERLRPAGRAGSRSVKRLLQEAGVPPWRRAAYPLIYVDDRLAAVPGIAVDAEFADASGNAWELAWFARPSSIAD
jgi:tRNA(Ile)-lysidine synthase